MVPNLQPTQTLLNLYSRGVEDEPSASLVVYQRESLTQMAIGFHGLCTD